MDEKCRKVDEQNPPTSKNSMKGKKSFFFNTNNCLFLDMLCHIMRLDLTCLTWVSHCFMLSLLL
jgi:hypothetical protein